MYTSQNFKTKKAMKEAVARGERVEVYQPNDIFNTVIRNKKVYLEGPHYPKPHRWYASATTDSECCIVKGTVR